MTFRFACVFSMLLGVCCLSVGDTRGETRPLNPKNLADQPHRLDINAKDSDENLKRFDVAIVPKDPKVPLEVASGYLSIQDGTKLVSGCEVKAESNQGAVWFQFVVAPA